MSVYNILKLKSDVAAASHGTTINSIQNFYGLCNRAASDVLLRIDPQETKRLVETPPVFNGVWDYAIPSDLKGNRLIDIRPQITRYPGDLWLQLYNQAFDLSKNGLPSSWQPSFTINFNTSVKSIRINSPNLIPGVTVNFADGVTSNGTWITGGDASNLQTDNINFVSGSGSLKFDLAQGGSSGYVENSTMGAVDLSEMVNQAVNFVYSYLPTASSFTSITFRWGSSASDYYEVSTSVTQENTVFQNAWNLLSFNWLGASSVGVPNPSSIGYCRVTFNYDGTAQTGVHVNGINSIMGRILEMEYYSNCLFRDDGGTFKPEVTTDSDVVNLGQEAYMVFFNRVMYLVAQQKQGVDASFFDASFFEKEYEYGIKRYSTMYPSEVQKPRSTYYKRPTQGQYTSYMGQWTWR